MTSPGNPIASLSLDLDNQWSYMKTAGNKNWEEYPSYLDLVIPRVLAMLRDKGLTITFFIVGQDAAMERHKAVLSSIVAAGHEVGNHSYRHEPWLHKYSEAELEEEIASAEEAIFQATGRRPVAFRGPGFSLTRDTLRVLRRRGYILDCSTFPTYMGPIARAYYFLGARLSREEKDNRDALFGSISDGLRPLKPYRWNLDGDNLLEIPVTTMPVLKVPFHLSYIIYLAMYSPWIARTYFRAALRACRLFKVQPSLLLHPLDFLGSDDNLDGVGFFPGMTVPAARKLGWVSDYLDDYRKGFTVLPMGAHAEAVSRGSALPIREPIFAVS